MINTIFTGAAVAIVTPMKDDGSVNFDKLAELVDYQIAHGTDAIVACGTTGESPTLNHAEHVDVIKETIAAAAGRVPVIAGTGSNDTSYAIELSKEAENLGADALLMVTPYYNKASQEGLYRHYTAVADSVDTPIILYNVPSRTGTKIGLDTYKRLGEHKNIVAAKEATGDISFIANVAAECRDMLDIYSGNDDQIVPVLSLGGKGVISVLSNVAPQETHDICAAFFEGDFKKSLDLQFKYLDLVHALFCDVNPICVKEAMNQLGYAVGECRLPLCETSKANKEYIAKALKEAGIIK